MAKINDAAASVLNEQLWDFDGRNYFNDGLADDDSWVENTSQGEEDLNEFDDIVDEPPPQSPSTSGNDPRDQSGSGYSCHALDFTLHTIVEESCEDSELEFCYNNNKCNDSNGDGASQRNDVSPTDMERYFVFGFDDQDRDISNNFEDSSSEIFSDLSDSAEQELIATKNDDHDSGQVQFDLSTSRLEKYFLSEFMGFSAENKSDSSVGSDSEGKPSPSQRKKKLRARRTPRSNHSSFDNLLVESAEPGEQSNESLDSSESDIDTFPNEVITCDKLDNINSVKRKKNYRKRENVHEPTTLNSSLESAGKSSKSLISALVPSKSIDNLGIEQASLNRNERDDLKNENLTKIKTSLGRTDSFNNWSSDEETNIMMSKMRQFFKTLIAVKTNNANANSNSCCIPTDQQIVLCKTKAIQFPYFESELIRLMKTVPGINNQQLREIVEYLSSEDTWSDSNDSSDFNASNINDVAVCKNGKRSQDTVEYIGIPEKSDSIERANNDSTSCFLGTETALMYTNLFESFMVKNSKISSNELLMDSNKYEEHHNNMCKSLKTEQLLVNIWQHIGQKLVNLMREDSMGSDCVASSPNTESITEISNSNVEEIRSENLPDNVDCSLVALDSQKQGCLPRSKSHDLLLATTNRSWHSYSNSAVNDNTGETSDGDRFSWRGSFESALLAPGDSRNKLLTSGRENGSRISQWSLLKRGSVDNLWCTNVQNRKHLDRVQSCGSILGNDEIKCLEIQKMWLSTYMANKSDEEASFTRTPHESLCTNSLPGLQSIQYAGNISNNSEFDPSDIQSSVKSARYRSPAMQSNISFPSSTVKRNENQIRGGGGETPYVNSLHKNITASSSLGDFSLTELNTNINNSPVLQRKSLYKRNTTNFRGRSESLSSVCSEYRYENVKVKGQVEFGMQYNYKINALEINVVQCKDLASVSSKRFKSDPYVKVYILPDLSKCGKRKTKVKKQTLNPVFNETLRFHVPISKLKKRSIWLTVWNSDLLGRNDFLGEVLLDLEDKVFDKPQSQWYTLQQKSGIVEEDSKYRGNLVVALKFIPNEMYKESSSKIGTTSPYTKGKLHILVKEAKYLYSNRNSGTCDTFCKSYLLPIRTKSTKQKTHVIKKSFNPMWNFTFVYEDLTINELSKRALELTVWDHDRLISNQFIGGVRFSLGTGMHNGNEVSWMESNDKETFLWREMMNRPNFWVEGSVKLRSNINDKREDSMESRQAIQTK